MAQLKKLKLTASVWDSDKDPHGFFPWMETLSTLVQATDGGMALETFINYRAGRELAMSSNVSSFLLDDPDFDVDPDPSRGLFPGPGK